jgi:hypothetical protein
MSKGRVQDQVQDLPERQEILFRIVDGHTADKLRGNAVRYDIYDHLCTRVAGEGGRERGRGGGDLRVQRGGNNVES